VSMHRASSKQLEVTEKQMTDSCVLGWNVDDHVHHLSSTVESTLASLPYDSLCFTSCVE